MKTQTQPKYTQGEWKTSEKIIFGHLSVTCNDKIIASAHYNASGQHQTTKEETEANAQRIVKAVNMHDELVATVKGLHDILFNQYKYEGIRGTEFKHIEKAMELLKQAEQK